MGRITGSASVDTLVRVGLEKQHGLSPESRMRVTQDFLATTDDELSAQTGDIVYKLFDDNEWVYVISEQSQEGFVPCICVSLLKDSHLDSNPQGSFKHKTKQASLHLPHRSDDSMLAEEGSDASNGSRELVTGQTKLRGTDDIAPPKPARGLPLDIPDVIGGNHQHYHHQHQNLQSHHSNHQKQQNNTTPDLQRKKSTGVGQLSKTPSPKNCHSTQYNSTNNNNNRGRGFSPSRSGGNAVERGIQGHKRSSTSSNITPQETPLTSSQTSLSSDPITEVRTFSRKPRGKLLVIFPFEAWDEGDMSVDRGEVVTALNTEDPLWTMVRKLNGQEGFVPAAFTCNYPEDLPGGIGSASGLYSTLFFHVWFKIHVHGTEVQPGTSLRRLSVVSNLGVRKPPEEFVSGNSRNGVFSQDHRRHLWKLKEHCTPTD
ncbi:cytoplasmic protein NCK2 [Elysia marginata]|uniref:Cytoplasmic protein NCK2 n=1 Tax=Elysia marginata TaxID=1093978 RepID=A0AAV4FTE9_9GAST|nr:cytoplasmic protein NCK2 [Elysia marginata]